MRAGWLVVLVGCGGGSGCRGAAVEGATFDGGVPGTGLVTFSSEVDGDAWVRWGVSGEALTNETPRSPAADGAIQVLGLPTGTEVEMVVVVDRGGKEIVSDPIGDDGVVAIPGPARNIIPFAQRTWEPSLACDEGGYVLFSYIGDGSSGIGIVDRDGSYVFSMDWPEEEQVARVRPGRDGRSLVYNVADAQKTEDFAKIFRVDLLGNPVSETRTLQGHHDFVEKSPGRFAWLGYDFRDLQAPPNGFGIDGEICIGMDTIYEADEGAGEADYDEVWNAWNPEDYPPGAYTVPEDAVTRRNGEPVPYFLKNGCYEFGHGNSLAYLTGEDAYYMNWRWLDVTMKVTGSGDLAWQWGGDFSDFALDPDSAFEGSHFSDVWPGGLLMFDNRNRDIGSRLLEYSFDDDGYDLVWAYDEPQGRYENLLGDVQRIGIDGCDNLLVSWSGQGKLQEITRDGEVVWEIGSGVVGHVTSRVFFLPDLYDLSGVGYPD